MFIAKPCKKCGAIPIEQFSGETGLWEIRCPNGCSPITYCEDRHIAICHWNGEDYKPSDEPHPRFDPYNTAKYMEDDRFDRICDIERDDDE